MVRLMGFTALQDFQLAHKSWVEAFLQEDELKRESHWTESIAAGSKSFVEKIKARLGFKAKGRSITGNDGQYQIREDVPHFGNPSSPGFEPVSVADVAMTNTFVWEEIP